MSATSGKQTLRNAVAQTNVDMAGFQLSNLDATNLSVSLPSQGSNSGKFLTTNGTSASWSLLPAGMGTQVANTLIAGPTTGADANATFRTLVAADVPSIAASKITSGALAATVGGTGQSSYVVGDLLYANSTTSLGKISLGAVGSFLKAGAVPSFSIVNFANDAIATGGIWVGGTANTVNVLTDIATGNVLLSGGVGVTPAYGKVTSAHADTSLLKAANNLSDVGTAATARNNILPTQTSNSGKFLTTDGTNSSWATVAGSGTFTSFAFADTNGFHGAVANSTTAPALTLVLADTITPDVTKTATFDCSNIATSTNRVINVPNANSTTAQLKGATSHNFLTAMSAQGVFTAAQPAVADISDYNANVAPAFIVLTDGAMIPWTMDPKKAVQNALTTLGGNRALTMSGLVTGMTGVLLLKQDGTGGRTCSLPAGSRVVNGGAGAVTLTAAAGAYDLLGWCFDGSTILWTILYNFT